MEKAGVRELMLPAVYSDTGHQFWDELHLPSSQKQAGSGNVSTPICLMIVFDVTFSSELYLS